jgi:hypothetical protein
MSKDAVAIMFDVAGLAAIVAAGFVLACASRLTALLQAQRKRCSATDLRSALFYDVSEG